MILPQRLSAGGLAELMPKTKKDLVWCPHECRLVRPPTDKQLLFIASLCEQEGVEPEWPTSRQTASLMIDALLGKKPRPYRRKKSRGPKRPQTHADVMRAMKARNAKKAAQLTVGRCSGPHKLSS